eukprot:TRINITY_DN4602_c0_g1_i2.p1 TRINITY_DN4602_c0_g1~~TRINITY_DN4602_c0_g1_i2.p1  ORF type:complete len:163 (-),score=15.68 TRINITY_DN4602_c0_g1_i2:429-917(-)
MNQKLLVIIGLIIQIIRLTRETRKKIKSDLLSTPLKYGYPTRKWKWLIRNLKSKSGRIRMKKKHLGRGRWGPLIDKDYDRFEQTGLFSQQFQQVYKLVEEDIKNPRSKDGRNSLKRRSNSLMPLSRVALVLTVLRTGLGDITNICNQYKLSRIRQPRSMVIY